MYLHLREILQVHIASNKEPHLSLCEKPTGAWEWNPESIDTRGILSATINGEGADPKAKPEDFIENLD